MRRSVTWWYRVEREPNLQPEDTSVGLAEMAYVRQFLSLFCHPFRHRDVLPGSECYNRDGTKQEHWSVPGGMQRGAVIGPRFVIFFYSAAPR